MRTFDELSSAARLRDLFELNSQSIQPRKGDSRYLLCGSDEGNIRMWKSVAWRQEGNLNHRQRAALNYNQKLKAKFKYHPQVSRIARHRHLPKVRYSCSVIHLFLEKFCNRTKDDTY